MGKRSKSKGKHLTKLERQNSHTPAQVVLKTDMEVAQSPKRRNWWRGNADEQAMSTNGFKECVVTVPLRDVQTVPTHERANRPMTLIHEHPTKRFKADTENVRLDTQINEDIWAHGRQSPPSKFRVRAAHFDEGGELVVETGPVE